MIEFSIPMLAPSLNGSKGLMRMHWAAYRKVRDLWTTSIITVRYQPFADAPMMPQYPVEECEVEITRYYATQPLDLDNLYAAAKVPLDAMRKAGVLVEDDPSVVTSLNCRQFKVPKKDQQKTKITLTLPTDV